MQQRDGEGAVAAQEREEAVPVGRRVEGAPVPGGELLLCEFVLRVRTREDLAVPAAAGAGVVVVVVGGGRWVRV